MLHGLFNVIVIGVLVVVGLAFLMDYLSKKH